jgi:hypothetical protein
MVGMMKLNWAEKISGTIKFRALAGLFNKVFDQAVRYLDKTAFCNDGY